MWIPVYLVPPSMYKMVIFVWKIFSINFLKPTKIVGTSDLVLSKYNQAYLVKWSTNIIYYRECSNPRTGEGPQTSIYINSRGRVLLIVLVREICGFYCISMNYNDLKGWRQPH